MRYLFDSSSIYSIVGDSRAERLVQNYTCDLARYELGNILVTERNARKTITDSEQKYLLDKISSALNLILILDAKGYEQEVINIATTYNLSFYDASYVYLAKKIKATLVTEDDKLSKKIKEYVDTVKAKEL